ncbi:MAG: amino acid ABC transporter ATP-binding protein [Candidatus Marinimicrobia bacterium]|jgi:ABC-type multidrug transport system ATPase subunit|nr:amino acid ABC transporter ATP-binding protein [Candidatus Neomarinimicrobiota bacterium]MBT6001727.1 amino acid ABC transporter ATP-binding protein [Candidatus Neomarinimicrobiota bacterium]
MENDMLFQFKDVHLQVDDLNILQGLNFEIVRGEFVAVIGASGAGKSSLLRMFNALTSPSQGDITFRGVNIDTDIQALRKNVGVLFQNPVVFNGTVRENLLIAGRWDQNISQTLDHEILAALDQVGLVDIKLTHHARDLSGGEQQRLALARTLLNHPQVILLDEPTSNLDPKLAREIMDQIDKLREALQLTIIAVSHDHMLMRRYAQRVIILSHGKIIGDGDFETLDKSHAFEDAGLLKNEVKNAT